ncbi:MAG TPA: Hsp20/alpha crystallin family protein [Campylobacterales bacterium]|nr:Hsp20/alpha crystallin family protein [Campylobacterales bacterium]HHS93313.1 Hsp20/alpha crystallin family protein [Campylobacterales bacterium]
MLRNLVKTSMVLMLPMVMSYADTNLTQKSDGLTNDAIFQHFETLKKDMDKVFERFNKEMFKDMKIDMHFPKGFSSSPSTDLVDKGEAYELTMDLAGMDEKSIKIEIEGNYLNVVAKSEKRKEKKENDKVIHEERQVGMVQRGMTLPKDADADAYKSEYKNGVLTILIPKKK